MAHKMSTRKVRTHSNWLCSILIAFSSTDDRYNDVLHVVDRHFFYTHMHTYTYAENHHLPLYAETVKWNKNVDKTAKRMMNKDNINKKKKIMIFVELNKTIECNSTGQLFFSDARHHHHHHHHSNIEQKQNIKL